MEKTHNIIEISMDNDTKLYIEAIHMPTLDDKDPLLVPVASEERVIKKTKNFLDDSLAQIKSFSNSIAESIKGADFCPDELELEFGVKFVADAGIIISSISSEANLTVKLKWSLGAGV